MLYSKHNTNNFYRRKPESNVQLAFSNRLDSRLADPTHPTEVGRRALLVRPFRGLSLLLLLLLRLGGRTRRRFVNEIGLGVAFCLVGKPEISQGQIVKFGTDQQASFLLCPRVHGRCFGAIIIPRRHLQPLMQNYIASCRLNCRAGHSFQTNRPPPQVQNTRQNAPSLATATAGNGHLAGMRRRRGQLTCRRQAHCCGEREAAGHARNPSSQGAGGGLYGVIADQRSTSAPSRCVALTAIRSKSCAALSIRSRLPVLRNLSAMARHSRARDRQVSLSLATAESCMKGHPTARRYLFQRAPQRPAVSYPVRLALV